MGGNTCSHEKMDQSNGNACDEAKWSISSRDEVGDECWTDLILCKS